MSLELLLIETENKAAGQLRACTCARALFKYV